MKAGTPEKLKFIKLQRALGETKRGTVGLLELLWSETAKNAMPGDIGRFSNEEIALLCDWPGDPDELVSALVQCGWLDECQEHRLVVHDWSEHCPTFVKGNLAKHHKEFAIVSAKQLATPPSNSAKQLATPPSNSAKQLATPPSNSAKQLATPPSNSAKQLATPPSKLLPSLAYPSQVNPSLRNSEELLFCDLPEETKKPKAKPAKQEIDSRWFQEWWNCFQYKKERKSSEKLFPAALAVIAKERSLSIPAAFEWLMDTTKRFVASLPAGAYRKHPDNWLKDENYFDEIEAPTTGTGNRKI